MFRTGDGKQINRLKFINKYIEKMGRTSSIYHLNNGQKRKCIKMRFVKVMQETGMLFTRK